MLQNLVTKAIETETEGVRREVLEKERKVKKKKYKGNLVKMRIQRSMKIQVSESFAAQRIYNSRNHVFFYFNLPLPAAREDLSSE